MHSVPAFTNPGNSGIVFFFQYLVILNLAAVKKLPIKIFILLFAAIWIIRNQKVGGFRERVTSVILFSSPFYFFQKEVMLT